MSDALVVVTGLSGAGKSTALRALEDLGYYCVDNLPPSLVRETIRVCDEGGVARLALGMDVRVGAFLDAAVAAVAGLGGLTRRVEILFLDADDEVLVRRFSETRRPHPVLARLSPAEHAALGAHARAAPGRRDIGRAETLAVVDGVRLERERLAPIRSRATIPIDTSHLSVHELRRTVIEALDPDGRGRPRLRARLMSFGYKLGLPLDADLVLDVRFLDNPFFAPTLRDSTGLDAPVRDFVLRSPGCAEFVERATALLAFLLPRYEAEGKSYLTVAIGCTGGRHRSVAIAVELAARLARGGGAGAGHPGAPAAEGEGAPGAVAERVEPLHVGIVHRDLDRGGIMTGRPRDAAGCEPEPEPEAATERGGRSEDQRHIEGHRT
ncbi:MAG: RNase adapter RapZ [Polyangiaceae bacterium]|nr:RNase adapter RapZ [Polyangiaceae bacterium]